MIYGYTGWNYQIFVHWDLGPLSGCQGTKYLPAPSKSVKLVWLEEKQSCCIHSIRWESAPWRNKNLLNSQAEHTYFSAFSAFFKVCLNRYSWGAGKLGSQYSSWFRWLECISWRFLTMSRLYKCLYHVRSWRNSSGYSKTVDDFLPLLMIQLVQKKCVRNL